MNIDDLIEEFRKEKVKSHHDVEQEHDDTGELFYQNIDAAPKSRLGYSEASIGSTKKDPRY